jgi:hypothetical protein
MSMPVFSPFQQLIDPLARSVKGRTGQTSNTPTTSSVPDAIRHRGQAVSMTDAEASIAVVDDPLDVAERRRSP